MCSRSEGRSHQVGGSAAEVRHGSTARSHSLLTLVVLHQELVELHLVSGMERRDPVGVGCNLGDRALHRRLLSVGASLSTSGPRAPSWSLSPLTQLER